ncbi:MAG: DUF1934 domain-containing protein [Firmicutes bacterium]|nr:DUF1934 domain-containing protein [Bacillota bacterium]
MRDITLKIVGKQCFEDTEEDQMEFITDGKIYLKNGSIYMMYDESEVSGMTGCKTTLKITDSSVKMRRTGSPEFGTELYFEEGQRFSSVYNTPFGPMELEVVTRMIDDKMDRENLSGSIDIRYDISLQGMSEGSNRLTIDVM